MSILENFLSIKSRIELAVQRVDRKIEEVTVVAVSKKQPIQKVQQYCSLMQGFGSKPVLGENYVQEFRDKQNLLPSSIDAHLIGPLQSNKAKLALELFDLIQSVHSLNLIETLNKEALRKQKIVDIFLQINVSKDGAKAGFELEEISQPFLKRISNYEGLRLQGLMCITQLYAEPESARADFRKMKQLSFVFQEVYARNCALSMGMSSDFEVAIEEGATHVRIGSALFGERE